MEIASVNPSEDQGRWRRQEGNDSAQNGRSAKEVDEIRIREPFQVHDGICDHEDGKQPTRQAAYHDAQGNDARDEALFRLRRIHHYGGTYESASRCISAPRLFLFTPLKADKNSPVTSLAGARESRSRDRCQHASLAENTHHVVLVQIEDDMRRVATPVHDEDRRKRDDGRLIVRSLEVPSELRSNER